MESIRLMIEIAGGLVSNMPSEKDLMNPESGDLLRKYLKGTAGISTEDRMKMFRLMEKLSFSSGDITSHIHGGGSPKSIAGFMARCRHSGKKEGRQEYCWD